MIKFFRHFRKALIEQNQMGKYFKYAIGEILLVVIGILLALQINNWNENRKLKQTERKLLFSIQNDLEADVVQLTEILSRFEEQQSILKTQSEYISSVSFSLDSLEDFVRYRIFPYINPLRGFNNNAYNSAKSSGKVEIIDTQLKEALFQLSVLQEVAEASSQTFMDVYLDDFRKLNHSYPIEMSFGFIKGGTANDLIWSDIDKTDLTKKLNDWGTSKANYYRMMLVYAQGVLDQTNLVLELIQKKQ